MLEFLQLILHVLFVGSFGYCAVVMFRHIRK